ncbi:MAG: 3-hydroxyacyl-CoA dehydrogenase NAD-binding domain-containing protein [bacterium]
MNKVIVLGAGIMGAGVAQVVSEAGYTVVLKDVSEELVRLGLQTIDKNLSRDVEKGTISRARKAEVLSAIRGTADQDELAREAKDADLMIEAVGERVDMKTEVYAQLDGICPPKTIFATNTSALSITELAASTQRTDRFIGLHFFNPVTVMQLVEVITGQDTSADTVEKSIEFVKSIGKVPVNVVEAPAFIVPRLLVPMINEAAYMAAEGVASYEDIDTAMRLGANHPIGPLALGDMIGLDVCLSVMETLQRETGDPKYRPCPILRKLVRAGALGRKTGQGFYKY